MKINLFIRNVLKFARLHFFNAIICWAILQGNYWFMQTISSRKIFFFQKTESQNNRWENMIRPLIKLTFQASKQKSAKHRNIHNVGKQNSSNCFNMPVEFYKAFFFLCTIFEVISYQTRINQIFLKMEQI